jgi:hypothetical protein
MSLVGTKRTFDSEPDSEQEHWVAVDGGTFVQCPEERAFKVARGGDKLSYSTPWEGVKDADAYFHMLNKKPKLSLEDWEFMAAYDNYYHRGLKDFQLFLLTRDKLNRINVSKGSYMANADVDGQLRTHESYIKLLTDDPPKGWHASPPDAFLLSAAFIKRYKHGSSFMEEWEPLVRGALSASRPMPNIFSILMWHTIEYLAPMVDFLEKMCAPTPDYTWAIEKKEKGDQGIALLLHWMFHVWGFGSRVPHQSRLEYDHLGQVASRMAAFK